MKLYGNKFIALNDIFWNVDINCGLGNLPSTAACNEIPNFLVGRGLETNLEMICIFFKTKRWK